ncbi:hypothetical protein ACVBEH_33425, partial [Roseateles sp. GG27B]
NTHAADSAAAWVLMPPLADAELSALLTQRWVKLQKSLQKVHSSASEMVALPEATPVSRLSVYQAPSPIAVHA